ncbi:MAG: 30S ribosomal protein S3 [Armatimonadetes bacterium]|nr:30S ribosomal protein S3 [Armatimonadota bacterium]
MGQKVNPIGMRLGIIRDWESNWYADKGYPGLLYEDYRIRQYLRGFPNVRNAAVSHVYIDRQAHKLRITLHTGKPGVLIGRGGKGVDDLKAALEHRTGKQVTLTVQEIRQPDLDAQLVAESIAQQLEKRVAPKRAIRQAIQRTMRMGAQGIKVLIAGRLGGSEMARRETDKQGKIPLQTLRADIDYGFAEAPTTYGHIGVKVWIYRGDILPDQRRLMKEGMEPEPFMPRLPRRTEERRGERRRRERRRGGRGGDGRASA